MHSVLQPTNKIDGEIQARSHFGGYYYAMRLLTVAVVIYVMSLAEAASCVTKLRRKIL